MRECTLKTEGAIWLSGHESGHYVRISKLALKKRCSECENNTKGGPCWIYPKDARVDCDEWKEKEI